MRYLMIVVLILTVALLASALDSKNASLFVYKSSYKNVKAKYDSAVCWNEDFSNHIIQDFGIDTTSRTQYKQINTKLNGR